MTLRSAPSLISPRGARLLATGPPFARRLHLHAFALTRESAEIALEGLDVRSM